MNLFKKILGGIIIASIIYIATYFLLNNYYREFNILDIGEKYWIYIIFLYISIIFIYVSRTNKILLISIGIIHFLRRIRFLGQILEINKITFFVFMGLMVIQLGILNLKYRIRYPLSIMIIGICSIIILNHTLPLYREKPDIEGFYKKQKILLTIESKDDKELLKKGEAKIIIKNQEKEKILNRGKEEIINLGNSETQILFSSKIELPNTYAHITFSQGSILTIYSQSAITLILQTGNFFQEKNKEHIIANILEGKINVYHISEQDTGYLQLTGNIKKLTMNQTKEIQNTINKFLNKKNAYLINQIGGEIMLNPTIDGFIGGYIDVINSLSKIANKIINYFFPKISLPNFDQNKINYQEFHKYLKYNKQKIYSSTNENTQNIISNTIKGRNASNTKNRRNTIKTQLKIFFN